LEMFAVAGVAADEEEIMTVFNDDKGRYIIGEIWFAGSKGAKRAEWYSGDIYFMSFGSDKYLIFQHNGATGFPCSVYGARDGELYVPEISGLGMALCYNENGELIYRHSTYDAPHHSWKCYWLYYDEEERKFKEYGGVPITLEQFMTFKNAQSAIDLIGDGEIGTIYIRGNGIVNINYTIADYSGAWDLPCYYDNITARYKDGEIYSIEADNGTYLPALCPEVAVYPDITGMFG